MNTIMPTVGRIVLVTVTGRNGPEVVPADVTHVHSQQCISVVAKSAFMLEGFHAGGTRPMTSIEYDEDPTKVGTWRWMQIQAQGGGFDARIRAIEERLGKDATVALTRRITKPKARTKAEAAKAKPRKR